MRIKLGLLCMVMSLCLCACSAKETPEISEFPRVTNPQSSQAGSGAPPGSSQAALVPTETIVPMAEFKPNKNAPIQLSLSFTATSSTDVKLTRMYALAMEFMRRNPNVYINLQCVNTNAIDTLGYIDGMVNNMINGTSTDIVIMDYRFPIRTLADTGSLADIGKLINSDRDISRSDFFENILDEMAVDGTLRVMPLSFYTFSYVMKKEYTNLLDEPFEAYDSLNLKTMLKVYDKALSIDAGGDIPYFNNARYNATMFLDALDIRSLNHAGKTVEIKNDEKLVMLDRVMNLPLMEAESSRNNRNSSSGDFFYAPQPTVIFADYTAGNGNFVENYLRYKDSAFTSPLPFANYDGEVLYSVAEAVAISGDCQEMETAWQFIKFMLGCDGSVNDSDFHLMDYHLYYPPYKELFREYAGDIFDYYYEKNFADDRFTVYSKDESIKNAISKLEEELGLAARRVHMNEKDFNAVWQIHYANYVRKTSSAPDTVAELERAVMELLGR